MAVIIGKRKRPSEPQQPKARVRSEQNDPLDDSDETARALFQRAFEAKFKPLEQIAKPVETPSEGDLESAAGDDDLESDWSGLSEAEDDEIEIIEHAQSNSITEDVQHAGKKAFMSSKPPKTEDVVKTPRKLTPAQSTEETDGTEVANLQNDLALQRLLKESHLLDPSSFRNSDSNLEGQNRLKALDMRLQGLGAKTSILQQEKMPLSHRKGIVSKTASRAAARRKEATENGIILERPTFAAKPTKQRERGIAGPGIGKFKGGTLKLSSHDVRKIQESSDARRGSGRKGRR